MNAKGFVQAIIVMVVGAVIAAVVLGTAPVLPGYASDDDIIAQEKKCAERDKKLSDAVKAVAEAANKMTIVVGRMDAKLEVLVDNYEGDQ